MRTFLAFLLILVTLYSCRRRIPDKFKQKISVSLVEAGKNKAELEKVIEHYLDDPDSLKLRAAIYLIENMSGMKTLDTNSVRQNAIYFTELSRLWASKHKKLEKFEITAAIDSINIHYDLTPSIPKAGYLPETQVCTAKNLIENIDYAFSFWKSAQYAKNLSFSDFCEYILPHRCSETYMPGFRIYFLKRFFKKNYKTKQQFDEIAKNTSDILNANFKEEFTLFTDDAYPYLKPITFHDLIKGRIGECYDFNTLKVNALRSMAIPAALDKIPGWGNSNARHYWTRLIRPENAPLLTNQQEPYKGQKDEIGVFWKDQIIELYPGIPQNIDISYKKTIPKVFRETYSIQKSSLAYLAKNIEIPVFFRSVHLRDVTSEYVKSHDVRIPLQTIQKKQNYIYLCCFDNSDWNIVDWGYIKNGVGFFKNVGKNIIYLPVYYENGGYIPASSPFLLNESGNCIYLKANQTDIESITCITKYPYRSNTMFNATSMLGGRLQLCNRSDLSDTVTVHTVNNIPFYGQTITVTDKRKYRYLIYQFGGLPRGHVAEIQFFSRNTNNQESQLRGRPVGNAGRYGTSVTNVYDDDPLSYFVPDDNKATYIALDLGQGKERVINKIKYSPRSDDNNIRAKESYSLYYWRNNWQKIADETAQEDNRIIFKNVPKNALLLLKNNLGGNENRPFTYLNGRQIFW